MHLCFLKPFWVKWTTSNCATQVLWRQIWPPPHNLALVTLAMPTHCFGTSLKWDFFSHKSSQCVRVTVWTEQTSCLGVTWLEKSNAVGWMFIDSFWVHGRLIWILRLNWNHLSFFKLEFSILNLWTLKIKDENKSLDTGQIKISQKQLDTEIQRINIKSWFKCQFKWIFQFKIWRNRFTSKTKLTCLCQ